MKKVIQLNPFVIDRYVSDEYFCGREQETEFLIKQIEKGRNITLTSPRYRGKTTLIQHCFYQQLMREKYYLFYVDLSPTTSLAELVYLLSKSVYKINLCLGDIKTPETTLDEIFEYLESAERPCVVAFDEFLRIGNYREKNVEAILRSHIKHCKKTKFIFAGSQFHLMSYKYLASRRSISNVYDPSFNPICQNAVSMGLGTLDMDTYTDFAIQLFECRGKYVDKSVIEYMYERFEYNTCFVHMMMNELFALTLDAGCCTFDNYELAYTNIVQAHETNYKDLLLNLTPKQRTLLQLIAKEGKTMGLTSAIYIQKYNLSSPSSVQSALKALLKRELIMQVDDAYEVCDPFFADWLAREY